MRLTPEEAASMRGRQILDLVTICHSITEICLTIDAVFVAEGTWWNSERIRMSKFMTGVVLFMFAASAK